MALPLWIILGVVYSQPELPAAYAQSSSFGHSTLHRDSFRAIALAPFGAWIRWSFTKFPAIKAIWSEINPHTLLANTIAVLLQSLLFAFAVGKSSWVNAINLGKCKFSQMALFWFHSDYLVLTSNRNQWIMFNCVNMVSRVIYSEQRERTVVFIKICWYHYRNSHVNRSNHCQFIIISFYFLVYLPSYWYSYSLNKIQYRTLQYYCKVETN